MDTVMLATVGCGRSWYCQYFLSNAANRVRPASGDRYSFRTLVL
jgi:hypothetical protein